MFGPRVLLLLVVITIALAATDLEKWQKYKKKFNKSYPNAVEDARRMKAFLKKLASVEKYNKEAPRNGSSSRQDINEFSDLLPGEINKILGLKAKRAIRDKKAKLKRGI